MLICHAVTLTFDRLPWKFVVYRASRDQNLCKIWAKWPIQGWIIDNLGNFCTYYVTMCVWPWPLTSWPSTFTALRMSCI